MLNGDGTVTFTPNANFNGTANFTYTVSDGTVTSNTATVTVTVAAVNDAPVANNDSLTATEDTAVIYTAAQLLGNDTDADGNTLTIASVTSGAGGTAVLNGDGTVTFTPNANFNGTADFTYTVTDGTLTSNTATVTRHRRAVNDAPVADNDSLTATEDTAVTYTAAQLLGNDTDADGNTLTIASVTAAPAAPPCSTATARSPSRRTPTSTAQPTSPTPSPTAALTSNTATVSVTVAAVNDAPVANNDSLAATEDTAVTYTAAQLLGNDTDAEGNTLTIASVTSGTGGTAVLNGDGTVTFTPNANFNGTADFTYTVTDGTLTSNTATVTVSVAAVNDAPVANNDSLTATEDTALSYTAAQLLGNDTDADGNTLTIASVTSGSGGTAVLNGDGTVTFTPNANFNGTADFTYTVTDGTVTSNTATVSVTIAAVNDAPVIGASAATGAEDSARVFSWAEFAVSDVDSPTDGLSLTVTSLPADGALQFDSTGSGAWVAATLSQVITQADIASGRLRFVPDADESGVDNYGGSTGNVQADYARFTFTVSDGAATSASGTMRIDITPLADATTITAAASALPAATGLTLTRHNNISGTQTLANVEAGVEADAIVAGYPTTIAGVTGAEGSGLVGNLGDDDAYRVSGFIYLQAGQSYTFTGSYGDMLAIELGGRRVVAHDTDGSNNDEETISGTAYMPTVSGFYSLELIVYNAGGDGGFANVSLNGLPLTTGNFNLYATAAQLNAAPNTVGAFTSLTDASTGTNASMSVAGYYAQRGGTAIQGQPALLRTLAATFGDSTDNSERHTITLDLTAAPLGTRVFVDANGDGAADDGRVFTTSAGNTSVVIFNEDSPGSVVGGANWNLSAIVVDAPTSFTGTFNVNAVARADEVVNGVVANFTTATQALAVTMVAGGNLAPDVIDAGASVSEEGLAGGLADSIGTTDTTNAASVSGTVSITDAVDLVADSITSVTLSAPATALTSNGVAVTWSGAGTGTLTASAGATPIATLTINTAGAYTFTLQGPIDHALANAEDMLSLNFGVAASDGVNSGAGMLTINIEDDQPSTPVAQAHFIAGTDTNLMIVLDLSGSMNDPSGIAGLTRLQAAVQSINTLIDRYDEFGQVAVRLVTFSSSAGAQGATWMTAAQAKTTLAALTATGSTNYDAALATAITAFADSGKTATGQNVAYFISDGAPTAANGDASSLTGTANTNSSDLGIQAAEETTWTNFLAANQVRSFAIGIGSGVPQTPLNPIAYDGQGGSNTSGVVVAQLDQFDNVLASTIQAPPAGNLAAGGTLGAGGAIGADRGYVKSVTIEGTTYSYNPAGSGSISASGGADNGSFDTATNTLTVTTSKGGQFAIDMDNGTYRYSAPDAVPASFVENVAYVISDFDGDSAASTISVTVDRTNTVIGTGSADTLDGTSAPDYMVGRDGDDVINGLGNNDVLLGHNGNDALNGGAGDDRLLGGAGNDALSGGLGADVIVFQLADKGTTAAPAADTISDFDAASKAAGGDVLDLRDLLQNETLATLDNYLDFAVSGGNTVISIKSSGSGSADQTITLTGVSLDSALGLTAGSTDQQIINELINRSKLVTDVTG